MRSGRGAVLMGLALLSSCSLPNPGWGAKITTPVRLPPVPSAWDRFPTLGYRLEQFGPNWRHSSRLLDGGRQTPVLEFEKGTPVPVLLFPLLDGRSDLLKPAGGVFPLTLDDHGTLDLSYRDGPLAALLVAVIQNEQLARSLNIARLRSEIWHRSEGHPWKIDREAILETLLYGVMRSDRIRGLPFFSLQTALPAGRWVSADPFEEPVAIPGETPQGVDLELTAGVHHFFRVDSRGMRRIDLQIDEEGWTMLDEITETAVFGRW